MRLSHVVLVLWLMTIIGFVWYWNSQDRSVNPNPNYKQTIKKLEQQNDSLLAINQGLQEQIAEQLEKQEGIKEELKKRNKDLYHSRSGLGVHRGTTNCSKIQGQ